MRKHLLVLAGILTAGTGCDNVEWGEFRVELKPPPPLEQAASVEVEPSQSLTGPENQRGPLLLAGVRDGERASFVLVGEVLQEALATFPDPRFQEDETRLAEIAAVGTELTLFSEGVRVGRMVTEEVSETQSYCGRRPVLSGVVELVPSAATAERLLAMPAADALGRGYEPYREVGHVYAQRVATLTIAQDAIREFGATWPTQGVLDARDHLQAFQLRNTPGEAIAATFMFEDELVVGPPGPRAYALFVIGEGSGEEYERSYWWYREVDTEGKGAPRYFDHLDWDGDGTDEILLDVFGASRRWFAALSYQDGAWARSFQDDCGSGSAGGG